MALKDQWIEFNDSATKVVDIDDFRDTAYLLFYEKEDASASYSRPKSITPTAQQLEHLSDSDNDDFVLEELAAHSQKAAHHLPELQVHTSSDSTPTKRHGEFQPPTNSQKKARKNTGEQPGYDSADDFEPPVPAKKSTKKEQAHHLPELQVHTSSSTQTKRHANSPPPINSVKKPKIMVVLP